MPLVAYLGSVDAVKFGGCLWGADAGDNGPVDIVGVTTDVPVVDLARALPFYITVLGRSPDLRPDDRTLEWILHRTPEIAVRVIERESVKIAGADERGCADADRAVRPCRSRPCRR